MKITKKLLALMLISFMIMQLFGCAVNIPLTEDISSADEAEAIGLSARNNRRTLEVGKYEWLEVDIKIDYNYALKWSSDNTDVATVDSNGRVDAIAPGKAIITAQAEKASVEYEVTVKEAKNEAVNISNAIVGDKVTVDQNRTNPDKNLYAITINVDTGCLTVYTYNSQGTYNVGVRAMVCSIAEDSSVYDIINRRDNSDQSSFYHIDGKTGNSAGWNSDEKGTYYRYRTSFSQDGGESLSFTSCAYKKKSVSALITEEYNKLGTAYTDGDIRLSVNDAKWIFDNCPEGTQIGFVYDGNNQDRLGVPTPIRIADECDVRNWDPTDPDKKNPFLDKTPTFKGMEDIEVRLGDICDLKSDVQVYDTCMNLVADAKFTIESNVSKEKIGDYIVSYYYTDSLGRTGRADRTVHVVK